MASAPDELILAYRPLWSNYFGTLLHNLRGSITTKGMEKVTLLRYPKPISPISFSMSQAIGLTLLRDLTKIGCLSLICSFAHGETSPARSSVIDLEPLTTFAQALDLLKENQISTPTDKQLFDAALFGMLEQTDAHGSVLTREEYQDLLSFTEGQLAGSGLTLDFIEGGWRITSIKPESNASNSGLMIGDEVLVINRVRIDELPASDLKKIEALLIDEAGSILSLETRRGRSVMQSVIIRDDQPKQQMLKVQLDDTLYIKIPSFTGETPLQVAQTIEAAKPAQVIIDVTDNLGGLLESALQTANLFVEGVPLIQVKSPKHPLETKTADQAATFAKLPLTLWVNHKTASAAEVFALSMQTNNRAKILGTQTYGKGTVQQVFPLPDGRALKFTVASYLSSSGAPINEIGVKPDGPIDTDLQRRFAELSSSSDAQVDENTVQQISPNSDSGDMEFDDSLSHSE